jgi:hypothetical protein
MKKLLSLTLLLTVPFCAQAMEEQPMTGKELKAAVQAWVPERRFKPEGVPLSPRTKLLKEKYTPKELIAYEISQLDESLQNDFLLKQAEKACSLKKIRDDLKKDPESGQNSWRTISDLLSNKTKDHFMKQIILDVKASAAPDPRFTDEALGSLMVKINGEL